MADSNVEITQGSGTEIDTRTEADNSQHRQVVVIGDPSTTDGVAPVDGTNGVAVDIKASIAIPAGTNRVGAVSSQLDTSVIMHGASALTPKFAPINVGSDAPNGIVASVTDRKLRVLQYAAVTGSSNTVSFRDGASTLLTGAMNLSNNGGVAAPFTPTGLFETSAGVTLTIGLGVSATLSGHLTYIEV